MEDNNKLKIELNKEYLNKFQKSGINYNNEKKISNNTDFKFKQYRRKSFDESKIRSKNELYHKDTFLNHRPSIAVINNIPEKKLTSEFFDELTKEIENTVIKIKAKASDLDKREKLFNDIELIAKNQFPDAKIYKYGSFGNDLSLIDGDIDVCIVNKDNYKYTPVECVNIFGEKLKENGIEDVKPLPGARVPIVKMKDKSGILCDIGFQNKLAIKNTKLINVYSKIDKRFKQMVFIIKYWSKMKNINEPYKKTLSSYCFILMIIHFLQNRSPPVLPNLQKIYLDNFNEYECIDGFNVSFFDNINELNKYWIGENDESLGKLVLNFFEYYAYDFPYKSGVASVRAGSIITKEEKEWTKEDQYKVNKSNSIKDRFWFCVEDPFEITHNLGRPVDKESLYNIRGKFMEAVGIIKSKNLSCKQVLEKLLEKND